jgi:RNA polymerase sigma-70 factor (ECF subfamily)
MMFLHSHDKRLVRRCLSNDRIAQKELFDKYYKAMFNTALRIVGDRETSFDVVQETFIHAFNNLQQFQFRSTLGAWIKTILIREAIRKKKDINPGSGQDESYNEPVTWPDDLSGDYLQKAIMELPDGFRMVFTLVEIEGYSHKEVAQIMHISEGTSKSQLYHAKKSLQKKLTGMVGSDHRKNNA